MVMARWRQDGGQWRGFLIAGLLLVGLSGVGYGLEQPAPPVVAGRQAPRLHVVVSQGRFSVDLWEAEVGEVLARLAHDGGLTILGGPRAGTRISAQFADLELEQGLRRLLRLASLSHAIRYTSDSTGTVIMHEVRLFEAVPEGPLPSLGDRDPKARAADSHPQDIDASRQIQGALLASQRGKSGQVWRHRRSEACAQAEDPYCRTQKGTKR